MDYPEETKTRNEAEEIAKKVKDFSEKVSKPCHADT